MASYQSLMEEYNLHTLVRLPNSVFKPYASIGTNLLFFEKGEPTKEVWYYEHRIPDGQKAYSMTKPIRVEHFKPCIEWWGGAKRKGRQEMRPSATKSYNLRKQRAMRIIVLCCCVLECRQI